MIQMEKILRELRRGNIQFSGPEVSPKETQYYFDLISDLGLNVSKAWQKLKLNVYTKAGPQGNPLRTSPEAKRTQAVVEEIGKKIQELDRAITDFARKYQK